MQEKRCVDVDQDDLTQGQEHDNGQIDCTSNQNRKLNISCSHHKWGELTYTPPRPFNRWALKPS